MSNARKHAEIELEILVNNSTEDNRPIVYDFIPEILALVNKFDESGQSGGSAPYTASAIADCVKKLCLFQPIAPIMGSDDEWSEVNDGVFQNKRCSRVFKDANNGVCYYLDAIVWKTEKGGWSGGALISNDGLTFKRFGSRQEIKSFPFKPKTFYIDVNEIEKEKYEWEFYIKYERQLMEVFEYYNEYTETIKTN